MLIDWGRRDTERRDTETERDERWKKRERGRQRNKSCIERLREMRERDIYTYGYIWGKSEAKRS